MLPLRRVRYPRFHAVGQQERAVVALDKNHLPVASRRRQPFSCSQTQFISTSSPRKTFPFSRFACGTSPDFSQLQYSYFSTDHSSTDEIATDDTAPPTTDPKNEIILTLLQVDDKSATDKAFRLFQEVIDQYIVNDDAEKPSVQVLERLLERLGESTKDKKSSALQAQKVFNDMINLHQSTQDIGFMPSTNCYASLATLWSRVSPDQAERVFWEILQPTTLKDSQHRHHPTQKALGKVLGQTLNKILESWMKAGKGKRCDALLSKIGRQPQPHVARPNPQSFQYVWKAWIFQAESSKTPKEVGLAARRVEETIKFMMQRYSQTKNAAWLPDPSCFPWLITAHGHARNPQQSQAVLEMIEKLSDLPTPTVELYNRVLEAYGRNGKAKEGTVFFSKWVARCQAQINQSTESQHHSNDIKMALPNHDSCLLLIDAWGQFSTYNHAEQAELVLQRMKELQETEQHPALPAPTVETYNAVLEAWSISRHYKIAKAVTNCERLLEEMLNHGENNNSLRNNPVAPNARTFELVVEAYARFGYRLYHRKKRVKKLERQMKHYNILPTDRTKELIELCQQEGWRLDDEEEELGHVNELY